MWNKGETNSPNFMYLFVGFHSEIDSQLNYGFHFGNDSHLSSGLHSGFDSHLGFCLFILRIRSMDFIGILTRNMNLVFIWNVACTWDVGFQGDTDSHSYSGIRRMHGSQTRDGFHFVSDSHF